MTDRESLCMMAGIVIGMIPSTLINIWSIVRDMRWLGQDRRKPERTTHTGGYAL